MSVRRTLHQAAGHASGSGPIETVVTALGVPGEGDYGNVVIDGTAPLFGVRFVRAMGARWSLSVNAAYGEAAGARRDVHERPGGATRVDTYDYGASFIGGGAENTWPIGRAVVAGGADLGWLSSRWRVASQVDPAEMEPPRSSVSGNVTAAARLGLRHRLGNAVALLGHVRFFTRPGQSAIAPEVGLRWSF